MLKVSSKVYAFHITISSSYIGLLGIVINANKGDGVSWRIWKTSLDDNCAIRVGLAK